MPSDPREAAPVQAAADHDPCCSSHGVPMTCERYRQTHFCEVRPCCGVDARRLAAQGDLPPVAPTVPRSPSMTGTEILAKLDLERVTRDAYSEVFEPSRHQVRDHQRALAAAVAAAVPHLNAAALLAAADEHQRLTDGERCCGPAPEPQCLRCGPGDEVADWLRQRAAALRGEHRDTDTTPPVREPRVWPSPGDRVVWDLDNEEPLPGVISSVNGESAVIAWDQGGQWGVYVRDLRPLTELASPPVGEVTDK